MLKWIAGFCSLFSFANAQTAEFLSLNSKLVKDTHIIEILWFEPDQEKLNDVLCLATNVYHEARGSTLDDQIASAHVVMNRVAENRWAGNVCQVVWQPYQFSWTKDGRADMPMETKSWEIAQWVAFKVYYDVVADNTGGSNHYHTTTVKPKWSKEVSYKKKIGAHYYMKL